MGAVSVGGAGHRASLWQALDSGDGKAFNERALTHYLTMARPLSEEKRDAILKAATDLVAAAGIGAPTAQIARQAGIAEGTLFTYFPTKDALLNQLYLDIKASLVEAILTGYPAGGTVQERTRHLWDRLIDWGATLPERRKAMRQLTVSDRVTEATRRQANAAFREVHAMMEASFHRGAMAAVGADFVGALLQAAADITLDFIAASPGKRDEYKAAGFEAFWSGVGR
jgi:AcrR family transcriptional regulator